jgi:hypothetical protein
MYTLAFADSVTFINLVFGTDSNSSSVWSQNSGVLLSTDTMHIKEYAVLSSKDLPCKVCNCVTFIVFSHRKSLFSALYINAIQFFLVTPRAKFIFFRQKSGYVINMASNWWYVSLSLLSGKVTGMCHHTPLHLFWIRICLVPAMTTDCCVYWTRDLEYPEMPLASNWRKIAFTNGSFKYVLCWKDVNGKGRKALVICFGEVAVGGVSIPCVGEIAWGGRLEAHGGNYLAERICWSSWRNLDCGQYVCSYGNGWDMRSHSGHTEPCWPGTVFTCFVNDNRDPGDYE